MTNADLIRRAQAAGMQVDTSGPYTYIHKGDGLTIKISPHGIHRNDRDTKSEHSRMTVQQASKALGLPRRDVPSAPLPRRG